MAVVTQKFAILEFIHTIGGAYILAGFFVVGISAWHLLRKNEVQLFQKSFRVALAFALVFSIFEILQGHMNAEILGTTQPAKLAAMESHWETGRGVALNRYSGPMPRMNATASRPCRYQDSFRCSGSTIRMRR